MMKRKFSFKGAPLTVERSNQHDDKPQSPKYSPPPSPFIQRRAPLDACTEAELREACAYILQEFKPSTQLYDEIVKSGYLEELQKSDSKPSKPQPSFLARLKRQPSDTVLDVYKPQGAPDPPKYVHVPANAARDFQQNATARQPSLSRRGDSDCQLGPLTPAGTLSAYGQHDGSQKGKAAALNARPKTSMTRAESYDNSTSTTNTNTTFDERLSHSTGVTTLPSASHTPGHLIHSRGSEQVLNDRVSAARADSAAKDWMALEFARRQRRLDEEKRQHEQMQQQQRPPSRAGSIRSLSSGLREYIRPQSSKDSLRSAYSRDEASSTKENNNSSSGPRWLSSLRRRGSFSSWRSGSGKETEDDTTPAEAVDLNRALPPLPGLDQYKEKERPKKKAPNHIAHLMRASSGYSATSISPSKPSPALSVTRNSGPVARIVDEDGLERTLSQEEEIEREAELRRAVEEKMRLGSIDQTPPVSRGADTARKNVRPISEERTRQSSNIQVSASQGTNGHSSGEGAKKMGALRRTFGRLSFGPMLGGKKSKTERNRVGQAVGVQAEG